MPDITPLTLIANQLHDVSDRTDMALDKLATMGQAVVRIEEMQKSAVDHLARINGNIDRHSGRLDKLEQAGTAAETRSSVRDRSEEYRKALFLVIVGGAAEAMLAYLMRVHLH